MLSDADLYAALGTGALKVEPFSMGSLQPASIDLHLGHQFLQAQQVARPVDPRQEGESHFRRVLRFEPYELAPQQFILASTVETVAVSGKLCAFVAGKSSLARHGLIVEAAGLVDPGFEGNLTLEVFNMAPWSIWLTPGMKIAQLYVHALTSVVDRPYGTPGLGSRYQGQTGPTAARRSEDEL